MNGRCSACRPGYARACSTSMVCSPTRPACTARRGKRCSTSTCAPAAHSAGNRSSLLMPTPTTTPTSTESRATTGSGRFWAAAASNWTTRPSPRRLGRRKNDLFLHQLHDRRRHGVRGVPALSAGRRRRGLRRAVVSSSANTREVLELTGLDTLHRAAGRRRDASERAHRRKARAGHVPGRPQLLGVDRRGRRVRGRARRSRRPDGPGDFGLVVGVDRVGQADALRDNGADVVVDRPGGAAAAVDDRPTTPTPSSRGASGRPSSTSTCWPSPSRCSRCPTATSGCAATSTRGSRTACPGTYLNSFYEMRPLPYAEAGYGYPEDGQTIVDVTNGKIIRLLVDDEPFDVRYGELHRARARLDLRAGTLEPRPPSGARRRASRSGCTRRGWSR